MQSDHSLEPLRGLVSHLLAGDQQHFDSEFDAMLDRFSYESMRGMLGCDEYWLLLAKFIQRCPAIGMKRLHTRLQSKLVDVCKQHFFTVAHLHFIRMLLRRCPVLVDNNQVLLSGFSHKCVDYVVYASCTAYAAGDEGSLGGHSLVVRLAMEVHYLASGLKHQQSILETIRSLSSGDPPYGNASELLPVDAVRKSYGERKLKLIALLWDLYSMLVEFANEGDQLDVRRAMGALEASISLNHQNVLRSSFAALITLAESVGGIAICRVTGKIMPLLLAYDSELAYATLCRLNNLYGVGGGISMHEHFPQMTRRLIELIRDEQESSSPALVSLVISIMKSSSVLLDAQAVGKLQESVCQRAIVPSASTALFKLFNALLTHSPEGIPLPLEVAQSVFSVYVPEVEHSERDAEIEKGRSICHSYCRPRTVPFR